MFYIGSSKKLYLIQMNVQRIILSALFLFISLYSYSQPEEEVEPNKVNWKEDIFFGGNISLQFGTITYINVSPRIGYRITDEFHAGVGATYIYFSRSDIDFQDTRWGGSVFSRYFVTPELFAHAELETLQTNYWDDRFSPPEFVKRFVPSFMIGGGYMQRLGKRGGLYLMALYVLNHDPITSPYGSSPLLLRGGIMF